MEFVQKFGKERNVWLNNEDEQQWNEDSVKTLWNATWSDFEPYMTGTGYMKRNGVFSPGMVYKGLSQSGLLGPNNNDKIMKKLKVHDHGGDYEV